MNNEEEVIATPVDSEVTKVEGEEVVVEAADAVEATDAEAADETTEEETAE